jgi:hypothetical protein
MSASLSCPENSGQLRWRIRMQQGASAILQKMKN